jgi:NAD(P)H-dependent FMN reductase
MSLVVVHAGESASSRTGRWRSPLEIGGGGTWSAVRAVGDGLGRSADQVDAAVAASGASILVLASPVYRATVSGALKAFLDRFATGALAGTAVVLIATAAIPEHYLSLDTGGRALVASLDGWTVPTVVYATSGDVVDGVVGDPVRERLTQALAEAAMIVP